MFRSVLQTVLLFFHWLSRRHRLFVTPTNLPLKLIDLSLKLLDLVLLESYPKLSILLPSLQCFKTLRQLPLLVSVLLYLPSQVHLSLRSTIGATIQRGQVLVDPMEDGSDLLLRIMKGTLQSVTL